MLRLVLAMSLALSPFHLVRAEEAVALESIGSSIESTAELLGNPWFVVAAGPDLVVALGVTMTALTTTAGGIIAYGEMKRRYKYASEEAKDALLKGDTQPITHAHAGQSLALVAELERKLAVNHPQAYQSLLADERKLATLVIARADLLERDQVK